MKLYCNGFRIRAALLQGRGCLESVNLPMGLGAQALVPSAGRHKAARPTLDSFIRLQRPSVSGDLTTSACTMSYWPEWICTVCHFTSSPHSFALSVVQRTGAPAIITESVTGLGP